MCPLLFAHFSHARVLGPVNHQSGVRIRGTLFWRGEHLLSELQIASASWDFCEFDNLLLWLLKQLYWSLFHFWNYLQFPEQFFLSLFSLSCSALTRSTMKRTSASKGRDDPKQQKPTSFFRPSRSGSDSTTEPSAEMSSSVSHDSITSIRAPSYWRA